MTVRAEWVFFALGERQMPSGEVIYDKYFFLSDS
jgi:hypothetical protein